MREVRFQINITVTPFGLRGCLALGLLLAGAVEVGSENVTLTTYYPAPSGIYAQMITTGNTYLARDSGSVGVKTTTPKSEMDIYGNLAVGSYAGNNPAPSNGLIVSGSVGIGTSNPGQTIEVAGNALVSGSASSQGYLYINNANSACATSSISGDIAVCTSSQYATWTPGLYVEGWIYQDRGGAVSANFAGGSTSQVWGLDTGSGNQSWMTLTKNDATTTIYCCPR